MSSAIEFEFSSETVEKSSDTLTIICLISSIIDDHRTNIETKLNCLTENIYFIQSDVDLKKIISSERIFCLLLIECENYLRLAVNRNSINEFVPIYCCCCCCLPSKVKCEFDEYPYENKIDVKRSTWNDLINVIISDEFHRRRQRQSKESLIICPFYRNALDRSSMEINGRYVQFQLLINCLLKMNSSENDREELLSFYRRKYSKEPWKLKQIHQFESYTKSSCLKWYTKESFVYRELNEALRTQNIHLLFLFRFLICDIQMKLDELRQKQTLKKMKLYRYQQMNKEEFSRLKDFQGNFISINSFISTTRNRNTALQMLQGNCSYPKFKRILFDIVVESFVSSSRPFADISSFSEYKTEEEFLLMLGSIFKIDKISDDSEDSIGFISLTLINENQSDYRHVYQSLKDQYCLSTSRYLSLSYVLIDMAKFHFAQFYLQRALEDSELDLKIFPLCYQALGKVSFENGFYQLSLEYFYRSIDLIERFHLNRTYLIHLYNNVGEVFCQQGFLLKAFHSFVKSLELVKQMSPINQEYLAWSFNNIGMIYQKWNNFDYAQFFLEEALRIKSSLLPSNHPSLGNTTQNIGNIFYSRQLFELASIYYHRAYEIFINSLAPDHPSIARVARNLALVYENQDKFDEAKKFFEISQTIRQTIFQSKHDDIFQINEDIQRISRKIQSNLLHSFTKESRTSFL